MLGAPGILETDFPLGRKLAANTNCWAVPFDLNLAGTNGAILVVPGATQGIVVTAMQIDESAAGEIMIGTATSLTGPTPITPVNHLFGAVNVATFTAQSRAGVATGFIQIYAYDVSGTVGSEYLTFNSPYIFPANAAGGFCIATGAVFTGHLRGALEVQEYPY